MRVDLFYLAPHLFCFGVLFLQFTLYGLRVVASLLQTLLELKHLVRLFFLYKTIPEFFLKAFNAPIFFVYFCGRVGHIKAQLLNHLLSCRYSRTYFGHACADGGYYSRRSFPQQLHFRQGLAEGTGIWIMLPWCCILYSCLEKLLIWYFCPLRLEDDPTEQALHQASVLERYEINQLVVFVRLCVNFLDAWLCGGHLPRVCEAPEPPVLLVAPLRHLGALEYLC